VATIEKRSAGKYRVKVRVKNQPPRSATFPSLKLAKQWAKSIENSFHLKRSSHTVNEAIERYCSTILSEKSPGHQYTQTRQLKWWSHQLGNLSLEEVTPVLIVQWRDHLSKRVSNGTVNRYLAALSAVLSAAVREWMLLDQSPMNKVRKLRESRGRVRWLTDDERNRLLGACRDSTSSALYTIVVLALSTGARQGELLNLTWNQVDLSRGCIYLDVTKNGERRILPLTGHVLELMSHHPKGKSTFVFPGPHTGRPLSIRTAWQTAVKRAKLEDFRFHDLRHTAVSYLAMQGCSLIEIAEILGHKDLSMTKRYSHLSQEHTRKVLTKMNEAIFS
jgi:integrase